MKKFFALFFALLPVWIIIIASLLVYSIDIPSKILNFGYDTVPHLSDSQKKSIGTIYGASVDFLDKSDVTSSRLEAHLMTLGLGAILITIIGLIIWNYGKKIMSFLWILTRGLFLYLGSIVFPKKGSARTFIIRAYISRLTSATKNADFGSIMDTHLSFFSDFNKTDLTNKEKLLLLVPKKNYHIMDELYSVAHKLSGNDDCISIDSSVVYTDALISFSLNKGKNTASELKSKVLENKNEFVRLLPGYDDGESIYETIVKDTGNDIRVEFYNKELYWKTQKINLNTFQIKKGQLLMGFYPVFDNGEIKYKDYTIESSNLIHALYRGSSGSGKDQSFRNIVYSIIQNIKKFQNFELWALDVKGNDYLFLSEFERFGLYRYADIEQYDFVLSRIESEMKRRIDLIGMKETFREYNESVPENQKLKEIFLVTNELNSLIRQMEKGEKRELINKFTRLVSQSRSTGIHCLFINQGYRKTGSANTGINDILLNIKDKFILAINEEGEIQVAGHGLGKSVLEKIRSLSDFTALHIEGGKLLQKYKAYFISKEDLMEYVLKNFEKDYRFENEKIQAYYEKILASGEVGSREAQGEPFNLSQKEWSELKDYLLANSMITSNPNNSISYIPKKSL